LRVKLVHFYFGSGSWKYLSRNFLQTLFQIT